MVTVVVKEIYNYIEFSLRRGFSSSVWKVFHLNLMCLIYLLPMIILVFDCYILSCPNTRKVKGFKGNKSQQKPRPYHLYTMATL